MLWEPKTLGNGEYPLEIESGPLTNRVIVYKINEFRNIPCGYFSVKLNKCVFWNIAIRKRDSLHYGNICDQNYSRYLEQFNT